MATEMLGTLISTTVAFSGMAAIFLLANVVFKAIGLGRIFVRSADQSAKNNTKADLNLPNEGKHAAATAEKADPEQTPPKSREDTIEEQLALVETPRTTEKIGRLRTGLRRARLLTAVVVFGLSVALAVSHLGEETPDWARACGWQLTGTIKFDAINIGKRQQLLREPETQRSSITEPRNIFEAGGSQGILTEDEIREALGRLEALNEGERLAVEELYAAEKQEDMWREKDRAAQRRLLEGSSPSVMAWMDNGERSCWSVTEVRLHALGIAILPALLVFLTTFVLIRIGRWLLVFDRPH